MKTANGKTSSGRRAGIAALLGFGTGVVAGSAYLLLGGEYFFRIPGWAFIAFYPGFVAGFKAYDLTHFELLSKVIGILAVGLAYAAIAWVMTRSLGICGRFRFRTSWLFHQPRRRQ